MSNIAFFIPGSYENLLTPSGRGRTIAAFHLAQGDAGALSKDIEMRRDVLNKLMSPSAVNYWLNTRGWLHKTRVVGRIQILRLTSTGIRTCRNSVAGGSEVPTTAQLVATWRGRMKNGGPSYQKMTFPPLTDDMVDP